VFSEADDNLLSYTVVDAVDENESGRWFVFRLGEDDVLATDGLLSSSASSCTTAL
jgi:hypothetical protein